LQRFDRIAPMLSIIYILRVSVTSIELGYNEQHYGTTDQL